MLEIRQQLDAPYVIAFACLNCKRHIQATRLTCPWCGIVTPNMYNVLGGNIKGRENYYLRRKVGNVRV